jgi:hypothetical protein
MGRLLSMKKMIIKIIPKKINYASNLSLYINGYHCKLFNELRSFNQGWYSTSEESEGSNIFIKNDRLIIYQ